MRRKEQIEELLNKGKHFCIIPWVHLHMTVSGYMTPCCQQWEGPDSTGYGSLNESSLDELWQGEAIRSFRLKMLNDEMDERCLNCYENEKVKSFSLREGTNSYYREHIDWVTDTDDTGYSPHAKPVYWDIRFSNLCNLRCRSCNFSSSSSWQKDWIALGRLDSDVNSKAVKGIKDAGRLLVDLEQYYPYAEQIYFAGGEPLLFKENMVILEKLNDLKKFDTRLEYNTNLTQLYKNSIFIKLWKNFDTLMLLISLDASYKKCEYLRKGLVWEDAVNNLQNLSKECSHADIVINFTVSAFNILHLPDFHKEMVEKGYIKADKIALNILHIPEYCNSRILPEELKKEAAKKIYAHIGWLIQQEPFKSANELEYSNCNKIVDRWYACVNYMNSADWTYLIPEFLEYTNKLDELRNERCLDIFPELEPVFNFNKNDNLYS